MQFDVERKFWKLFGATVRSFTPERQLVCYAKQKAFKLKEHVEFFSDEAQTQEMFSIKARSILDIAATYDIFLPDDTTLVGSLKRSIGSAFVRDEWIIMNASGQEIGRVTEDSNVLGLLRRYVDLVSFFVPQRFDVCVNQQQVGSFQQKFNPLLVRMSVNYEQAGIDQLGSIMVYAIPNMIAIIEARQN